LRLHRMVRAAALVDWKSGHHRRLLSGIRPVDHRPRTTPSPDHHDRDDYATRSICREPYRSAIANLHELAFVNFGTRVAQPGRCRLAIRLCASTDLHDGY